MKKFCKLFSASHSFHDFQATQRLNASQTKYFFNAFHIVLTILCFMESFVYVDL